MGNEKEIGSKNFAPVIRLIDSLTRQGYPPSQIIEFIFLSTLITASEVFPADAIKNLWDKAVTLYEQRRQTAAQEYNDDLHLNAIFLEAEKPFHVAIEHLKSLGFSAHTITAFLFRQAFYTSYHLHGHEKTEEFLWSEHRRYLNNIANKNMPPGHC